jgi:hypothetical protein
MPSRDISSLSNLVEEKVMCARLFPLLAVAGLVAVPSAAWPKDEAGPAEPALTVRVKSVDDAIASGVNLAATVMDKDAAQKAITQAIEGQLGPKGLKGLDARRPLGLYGTITAGILNSLVVIVLPVSDEDDFLDLLARAKVKVEKAEDGVYKFMAPKSPFPGYLRFVDRYAYLTVRDPSAIAAGKLLKPADLFPARETSLAVATVRIDRIPDPLKKQLLDEIAKNKLLQQKKKPGETEAQTAFNRKLGDKFEEFAKALLQDGREAEFRFDSKLGLDVNVTAKPGSQLAADFAELGRKKSRFANMQGQDPVMSLLLHFSVPDDLRQQLDAVIDDGIKEAVDKEKDNAKREILNGLFKALTPTFRAGEYDGGLVIRSTPGDAHATMIAGLALKDGAAVERAFRDTVKKLPEASQAKIKLDAETASGVKIHRLEGDILNSQNEKENKNRQRAFGDKPLYVAFSDDAAFAAMGENGLSELKQALAATPQASPPIHFAVSLPRFGELAADNPQQKEMLKRFGEVGFTLEGGPSLKVRMQGMGMAAVAGIYLAMPAPPKKPAPVPSPKPGDQ